MKKTLLMLVALFATVTAFAEDQWKVGTFTPVSNAAELSGLKTVVASNGDVYASSTYNQVFSFAGANITDPEGFTSACIVKYDKDANEKWAVALIGGSAKVTAMTVDADGTLYATGTFLDTQLTCFGANNAEGIIVPGSDETYTYFNTTAFIAVISPDGAFKAVESFSSTVDKWIAEQMIDDPDFGPYPAYMSFYYPPTVSPNNIKVDGDKLYISALYRGDVSALSWEGRYNSLTEGGVTSYIDNDSYGVFSVNKSDLKSPASVANLGCTTIIMPEDAMLPYCFNIAVDNGKVYAAFFGWGNLTLSTPTQSKDFTFKMEGEGKNEHAFVLSDLSDIANKTIEFNATPSELPSWPQPVFNIYGDVINGKALIAGTFQGSFPLDETVSKTANTSFAASINLSTTKPDWKWINDQETEESVCTGLVVTGAEMTVATKANLYQLGIDGTYKKAMDMVVADGAQADDKYVAVISGDETGKVTVMIQEIEPSGIEAIKAAAVNGEAKIYNLNGQRVAAPQKGLYIVNGRKAVVK